ncbi:MAG: hypothetical protein KGJ55_08205 [Gammaproteobacteria bacterium]|nr:hypothetical protein [Gammaproteobacteria bacterium]
MPAKPVRGRMPGRTARNGAAVAAAEPAPDVVFCMLAQAAARLCRR